MTILIDGFNLIYKFPELEEMMYRGRLSAAREGLLEKLKLYQKITGYKIRVVLDGKKDELFEIKNEKSGNIDVYYSLEFSADYLIKEFIKKDINPRMTTVITSDKDIINFVSRFRAKVRKSEEFAEHINRKITEYYESRNESKDENPVLSEDEITFWARLFGKKT